MRIVELNHEMKKVNYAGENSLFIHYFNQGNCNGVRVRHDADAIFEALKQRIVKAYRFVQWSENN